MKKEKPIIFSTLMVQAILNTKPGVWPPEPIDPEKPFKSMTRRVIDKDISNQFDIDTDGSAYAYINRDTGDSFEPAEIANYHVGEILWVRETWQKDEGGINYRADQDDWQLKKFDSLGYKWKSSMFMPRKAARLFLEVKSVKIERLQDISEADAILDLNAKRGYSWDSNHWVWVYEFMRIEK